MSTTTIEELRNSQEFIPWNEWPNQLHTNCISYALGLPIDDPKFELFGNLLNGAPIDNLKTVFASLGLCWRQVASEDELETNEYGIVLYHYYFQVSRKFFGCEWLEEAEEIHLARIQPDGTWTHKFGWNYDASITTPEEIQDIILRDDGEVVFPAAFFAIRKP